MNIIKIICCLYIYNVFNCAFRYRSNEHNRKRTLRNKNLKSLFQNYNLTYFSKHLEYNKFEKKNVVSTIHMLVCYSRYLDDTL